MGLLCSGCGKGTNAAVEKEPPASKASQKSGKQKKSSQNAKRPRVSEEPNTADNVDSTSAPESDAEPPKGSDEGSNNRPVEKIYRPSDNRPRRDDEQLKNIGINKYTSKHLWLYTDLEPVHAEGLPALMDQAYAAWEDYFGPLPPNREGTDFQMTGYIMVDRARFREAGLLPEDLPGFLHGRHRGAEFWMNDQEHDYYRRHLMLHEGTHCFMTIFKNVLQPAVWYMEGMAELFGTHALDTTTGKAQFRVMPGNRENFQGLGRIRMVHDDVAQNGLPEMETIFGLRPNDYLKNDAYAWSWALCKFLDTHPRYRDRFRHITQHVSASRLDSDLAKLFDPDTADLHEEWLLFAKNLCHGYDIERAAIEFKAGKPVGKTTARAEIAADRGWQSSGVLVEKGGTYRITADGRYTVAQLPEPWECEPQGVSIRYCEGKPLGMLLGTIRSSEAPKESPRTTMLKVIPIGRELQITAEITGTLYLRVNDFWNELADNTGKLEVIVEEVKGERRG